MTEEVPCILISSGVCLVRLMPAEAVSAHPTLRTGLAQGFNKCDLGRGARRFDPSPQAQPSRAPAGAHSPPPPPAEPTGRALPQAQPRQKPCGAEPGLEAEAPHLSADRKSPGSRHREARFREARGSGLRAGGGGGVGDVAEEDWAVPPKRRLSG